MGKNIGIHDINRILKDFKENDIKDFTLGDYMDMIQFVAMSFEAVEVLKKMTEYLGTAKQVNNIIKDESEEHESLKAILTEMTEEYKDENIIETVLESVTKMKK